MRGYSTMSTFDAYARASEEGYSAGFHARPYINPYDTWVADAGQRGMLAELAQRWHEGYNDGWHYGQDLVHDKRVQDCKEALDDAFGR